MIRLDLLGEQVEDFQVDVRWVFTHLLDELELTLVLRGNVYGIGYRN
ncbi:hypothetical protein [Pedobacter sp. GR22-6]